MNAVFSQQSVLQVQLQVWCCQVLRHVARRHPRISHCSSSSVLARQTCSCTTSFPPDLASFLVPLPLTLSSYPPPRVFVFPCFFTLCDWSCLITGKQRLCFHSFLLALSCVILLWHLELILLTVWFLNFGFHLWRWLKWAEGHVIAVDVSLMGFSSKLLPFSNYFPSHSPIFTFSIWLSQTLKEPHQRKFTM